MIKYLFSKVSSPRDRILNTPTPSTPTLLLLLKYFMPRQHLHISEIFRLIDFKTCF